MIKAAASLSSPSRPGCTDLFLAFWDSAFFFLTMSYGPLETYRPGGVPVPPRDFNSIIQTCSANVQRLTQCSECLDSSSPPPPRLLLPQPFLDPDTPPHTHTHFCGPLEWLRTIMHFRPLATRPSLSLPLIPDCEQCWSRSHVLHCLHRMQFRVKRKCEGVYTVKKKGGGVIAHTPSFTDNVCLFYMHVFLFRP